MSQVSFIIPSEDCCFPELRTEVRRFLSEVLGPTYSAYDRARSWTGHDPEFSRALGQKGWLGMTLPKEYGGHAKTVYERFVVIEELLAAGAPVAAHWIADRQSAQTILRFGTEEQRKLILPNIVSGTCFFCIGMSEPDSGSDLAATRTKATPIKGGFLVNGTKLWTTNAHKSHYMILFCRTGSAEERHGGTSQFLVDLSTPGITIKPIIDMAGEHHFNEVSFQDVFLPEGALIGKLGEGWKQVTHELALERSGPERFLSSFALLTELVRISSSFDMPLTNIVIGRLTSHLMVLRQMSLSIAEMISSGRDPMLEATIVKDLGAIYEQEIPETVRQLIGIHNIHDEMINLTLQRTILAAPTFSIRGGTREILRGIIARQIGLR